jgi:transaldolase
VTPLQQLFTVHGQSPWLDNLTRGHVRDGTLAAARALHERIDRPNVMVKVPATDAGIPAIRTLTAEGRNINITLIFSLPRYRQVIDAYLAGLEQLAATGIDMDDVGRFLELQGIAAFHESFVHVLAALDAKAHRQAA